MKRIFLALVLLAGGVASANATCAGPAVMKDNSSTTFSMSLATNAGDGNCASNVSIVGALPPLAAGSNIIGNVGIDQTTPGTTNAVSASAAQATVSAGNSLNGVTANTTGTAVPMTGFGQALININCSVNCSGGTTVAIQGTDIVGYQSVGMIPVAGASGMVSTVVNQSGAAMFCVPNFGYTNLRANVSSYSAGTISVTITPFNGATCDVSQVANTTTAIKGSSPVVNGADTYNTVAASQTAQALTGGSGGAAGDYLSHCVVQPSTTAAGTVTILDNSTTIYTFTTGTLSNLVPFAIPVGAVSTSGAWKITTGANETVTCVGKFT